jgi:hypothetical protein
MFKYTQNSLKNKGLRDWQKSRCLLQNNEHSSAANHPSGLGFYEIKIVNLQK